MAVPQVDLVSHNRTFIEPLREAFVQIMESGGLLLGPHVEAFEQKLATYCGTAHAVACASGTDAILMALMALDIGPGDEVIVPTYTFFATAGCVARVGATPVFVDIDPAAFNIDAGKANDAVTDRTRAIIPVHLYGQMAAMASIMSLAERRGIAVIEDAAQAIGAAFDGRRAGSIGLTGAFSFYPTKNLSALGDAGAITTNDQALATKLRSIRVHGQTGVYEHAYVGGNFRLDAIQGAALALKMDHADAYSEARRKLACRYEGALEGLPLTLPPVAEGAHHVYNQYTVRVADGQRDGLLGALQEQQIAARVFYPMPLHRQPCFAHLGHQEGDFPEAERACGEVLCLPIYPELTEAMQDEVISAVREYFA